MVCLFCDNFLCLIFNQHHSQFDIVECHHRPKCEEKRGFVATIKRIFGVKLINHGALRGCYDICHQRKLSWSHRQTALVDFFFFLRWSKAILIGHFGFFLGWPREITTDSQRNVSSAQCFCPFVIMDNQSTQLDSVKNNCGLNNVSYHQPHIVELGHWYN